MTAAMLAEIDARFMAVAPFTADDVAFCQERLDSWHDHIARHPAEWAEGGNDHIWREVLARISAHARGESADFTRVITGVAIDGAPSAEPRCCALLLHMLQAAGVSAVQAVLS